MDSNCSETWAHGPTESFMLTSMQKSSNIPRRPRVILAAVKVATAVNEWSRLEMPGMISDGSVQFSNV